MNAQSIITRKSFRLRLKRAMKMILWAAALLYAWFAISRYSSRKKQQKRLLAKEALLREAEERRASLISKYGDAEVADNIMARMFWQGQSSEQLVDSIGRPLDVDRKVMKTKTSEVWKYHEIGKGRFALRIKLEDGLVVGWDKKS